MHKQDENLNQADDRQPRASLGSELFGHVKTSIIATIVLAIVVSGIYPAIVWGLAQVLFHDKANGSLIGKDGKPVANESDAVGSSLIGQNFSDAKYFHPRPSAAGNGYDPTASGGSNLGPTSAKLMFGTTKNYAFTIFVSDKGPAAVVPVNGRLQGIVTEATKTTISISSKAADPRRTKYTLDPAVADPNTVVAFHGRTIHSTTIPVGSMVELKLNDKTPAAVVAINVVDQETDAGISAVDTTANKITLSDSSNTVINVDPKNTVFVLNGKADAKLDSIAPGASAHVIVSQQMDYDGIADRVIHYCQDNKIDYKSSVPDSAFTDADGVDDGKLITAFNGATLPTITPDPAKPVPADAVTASGSGLDPHISIENAKAQSPRVADARKISVEKVNGLISQYTDGPSLGVLGESGVNVLQLNLALDQIAPVAPPAPTTAPTTIPAK